MSEYFNPFKKHIPLTAEQVAKADLEDAKLKLLQHRKDAEYHTAMATMLEQRIHRLNSMKISPVEKRVLTGMPS